MDGDCLQKLHIIVKNASWKIVEYSQLPCSNNLGHPSKLSIYMLLWSGEGEIPEFVIEKEKFRNQGACLHMCEPCHLSVR